MHDLDLCPHAISLGRWIIEIGFVFTVSCIFHASISYDANTQPWIVSGCCHTFGASLSFVTCIY